MRAMRAYLALRDGLRVIRAKNLQPERIEGCGSSTFGWARSVQRVLLVLAPREGEDLGRGRRWSKRMSESF